MSTKVTETFFLPHEISRESTCIPADLYNITHTILKRSDNDCVFVPIRSLQYLGIITEGEVVFVDSMAYTVQDGHGGRLIKLSWQFHHRSARESLGSPVQCDVVRYHEDAAEIELRLVAEFRQALKLMDERYREHVMPQDGARILKLGR